MSVVFRQKKKNESESKIYLYTVFGAIYNRKAANPDM